MQSKKQRINDDIRISDQEMSLLTPRENKTLTNYLAKKSRNESYTAESGKKKSSLTKDLDIFE